MSTWRRLEYACLAALLVAGAAWVATLVKGRFDGHSLMNAQIAMAVSFVSLIALRSKTTSTLVTRSTPGIRISLLICAAIPAIYHGVTSAGFLYDDYTHVAEASRATWASILRDFGPIPNPPGLFFRPFGFLLHWLNYLVAARDPMVWHGVNIMLHAANSVLLLAFCGALRFNKQACVAASLLFAFNAALVEAATWIDARFDAIAAALALVCLLCLSRYLDTGLLAWITGAAAAATLAVLSKESAFCLPLLAASLVWFRPDSDRPRLLRGTAAIAATCGALFVYRWWAIGGLGGYRAENGQAMAARLDLTHSLKAVLVQDWAVLLFPVNWLEPAGFFTLAVALSAPVILAVCAWRSAIERRVLAGALCLTLAAALPVHNMLLIGSDLSGARVLYLPSIGLAVLWAGLFHARPRALLLAALIGWQVVMLRHNAGAWIERHAEASAVCEAFANEIRNEPAAPTVQGLPQKKRGVVFLANGISDCVGRHIEVVESGAQFVWNDRSGRIERRLP